MFLYSDLFETETLRDVRSALLRSIPLDSPSLLPPASLLRSIPLDSPSLPPPASMLCCKWVTGVSGNWRGNVSTNLNFSQWHWIWPLKYEKRPSPSSHRASIKLDSEGKTTLVRRTASFMKRNRLWNFCGIKQSAVGVSFVYFLSDRNCCGHTTGLLSHSHSTIFDDNVAHLNYGHPLRFSNRKPL